MPRSCLELRTTSPRPGASVSRVFKTLAKMAKEQLKPTFAAKGI